MKFNEYDVVKTQYTITEQYKELSLYLCADKECTDHVWQVILSLITERQANKNFYIFAIPKGLDFTEEKYELFKQFFERYVKLEKVKEKLERIKKDFV